MRISAAFLISLFVCPLLAQRSVPIDNEQVRVLSVVDNSTGKGKMHEHPMNRVMVYLDAGKQRIEYDTGKKTDLKFKAGEVLWSPQAGMHTSENVGGKPYRIVEIELKQPGKPFTPPALDPVKVAPKEYKVVLDNAQVRAVRCKIPARGQVPMHEHALHRVAIFMSDVDLKVTPKAGEPTMLKLAAGDIRWGGPAIHREENLSDKEFDVIIVEIK
jgi:quercetin dioxygenase-like cupin family protein